MARFHSATKTEPRCTLANLTIKNMPDWVYERLKQRAAQNHRSINQEAIFTLSMELMRTRRTKAENEQLLAKLDAHADELARRGVWIPSDEWLNAAIDEGQE